MLLDTKDAGKEEEEPAPAGLTASGGVLSALQTHKFTDYSHQLCEVDLAPILQMGKLRHRQRLTNVSWENQNAASSPELCSGPVCSFQAGQHCRSRIPAHSQKPQAGGTILILQR